MTSRVLIILSFCLTRSILFSQAFQCPGEFILAVSPNADSSRFYTIEINEEQGGFISFDEFSEKPGPYLNALGYRRSDNYIYGIAPNTHDLYRLDASGNTTFLHHFDNFDETKNYNAGAVTPDSKYLVVLSGKASSAPLRSEKLILIDLESPDYNTTFTPITTLSGEDVYSLDISFDPISGDLYGYDGIKGRLLTIQLYSAQVDDEAFPATGIINTMAALFFDAFGNLYGYAKHLGQAGIKAFYQISKEDGSLNYLLEGPYASASDGCSCPYRVELLKSVNPLVSIACSEVEYLFEIVNTSGIVQSSVQFQDVFPSGFEVLEVSGNVFNGQVEELNTGTLTINNMMITPGLDSFIVRVAVGNIPPGIYKNQAVLTNLISKIGGREVSDNPNTLVMDDSTVIEILPLEIEEQNQFLEICSGDTLLLDATLPDGVFSYSWGNGSTEPILEITEAGIYDVIATNVCETISAIFEVEEVSEGVDLDLGPDRVIRLGERIFLNPNISNANNLVYSWSEASGQTITCNDCPNQELMPTENTTYSLLATDEYGCTFVDSVQVIVEKEYNIYASNSFSPNKDGVNDFFFIGGVPGTFVELLQIYNRWGGLIFEVKNVPVNEPSVGWDGLLNGNPIQSGVYVWMVKVKFVDGKENIFSGDVAVID